MKTLIITILLTTSTLFSANTFAENNKSLALGGNHGCAILADSTVSCWGSEKHNQMNNFDRIEGKKV